MHDMEDIIMGIVKIAVISAVAVTTAISVYFLVLFPRINHNK